MPVQFADVMREAKQQEPELEDERLEALALRIIKSSGLSVSPTGEVFNEAEGCYGTKPVRVVARNDGRAYSRYSRRR